MRSTTLGVILFIGLVSGASGQKAAQLKVPETVIFEPNVEYADPDGQHLQLDLARPKNGDGPFPAILCIHGGGFRAGSRQGYDGLCIRLAEQGYVAATVSYRLAPKYQFPAAIHDVKAAVRWLRANARKYKINPDRIGVTGGSAGGHLAQFLGVTADIKQFEGEAGNPEQSSRVACVVNYYGPSDFTRSYGKSVDAAQVLPLWLGGNLEQARQKHILASPLSWVTPNAAPTLCIHGTQDKYVAHEQAVWLTDRLKAVGVEAELLTLENAGHGFRGKDAERAEQAMLAFFARHLKPAKTSNGHRVLGQDRGRAVIVNAKGEVEWEVPCPFGSHDIALLPNGNLLLHTGPTTIVEMTPAKQIVWRHESRPKEGYQGKVEIHSFQRLDDGLTMVAESGNRRIIEVDKEDKIVREIPLTVNKPSSHHDTRLARKLANGHYLVCHEGDGVVREYDDKGKVVWSYTLDLGGRPASPGHGPEGHGTAVFGALRRDNGNTLIATGNGNRVIEVDREGKIVWSIGHDELPGVRLGRVTTLQLLPNGNLIVGNCHAGATNPQLFEVTRDKKVVWTFQDFKTFGNSLATAQVLAVKDNSSR